MFKGVFGCFGDFGVIDKEYDVAVSIVCGFFDYILVEIMFDV